MTPKDYTDFMPYDSTPEQRQAKGVGNIFFNQIECGKCGWFIRSRNRHHMETCKCGAVSIDGGSHYSKISGEGWISHIVMYKNVEEVE